MMPYSSIQECQERSTEFEQSSNFNHGQHCAGVGETSECLDNEMVSEVETEYVVNNGEESMEEIFSITSPRQILMKSVAFHICLFISFFQLCYHVSERGITLLLNFIRSLISWLSRFAYSPDLLQLRDMIPENVYFLKNIFKGSNDLTTFVVCPKCHSI